MNPIHCPLCFLLVQIKASLRHCLHFIRKFSLGFARDLPALICCGRDSELIDAPDTDNMTSTLPMNEGDIARLPNPPTQEKHLSYSNASLFNLCNPAPQKATTSLPDSKPDGNYNESNVSDDQLSGDALRQKRAKEDVKITDVGLKYLDSAPEIADSGSRRGKAISNDCLTLSPEIIDVVLEPDYATLPQLWYASPSCVPFQTGLTALQQFQDGCLQAIKYVQCGPR